MGEQRGNGTGAVLLADRGARSREIAAVLLALARTRSGATPFRLQELDDVEDLLAQRDDSGTLILESGRVPAEDIGFVRRFLERRSGWRLVVLGDDAQDGRARGLLALPRAQWLPWPPDLDQLAAQLSGQAPTPTPAPAPPPPANGPPRAARPAPADARAVPADDVLEELLAGMALGGSQAPRFLYRSEEELSILGEEVPLQEGLAGLFELARVCAGEGQVVNVGTEAADERVRLRVDFPLGPLTDADLPGLFEGPFEGGPDLVAAVEAARRGASTLATQGAAVDLLAHRPGRLRFEVLFPRA